MWSKEDNDPFEWTFDFTAENFLNIVVWNVVDGVNCGFESICSLVHHFFLLKCNVFLIDLCVFVHIFADNGFDFVSLIIQ